MEDILPMLKAFISKFFDSHYFRLPIKDDSFTLETSIDFDLKLYDLDIDLFLADFVRKFNVDYSQFDWKNHGGYPDHLPIRYWFYKKFFDNEKVWVKEKLNKIYTPKLKIADLQNAIKTGKLI